MSIGVSGQYVLSVKFGNLDIPVNSSNLKECQITQNINHFLPEFRFRLVDTSGILSHILPFDKSMSRISFTVSTTIDAVQTDFYDFTVYRRELVAEGPGNGEYDIRGLLTLEGLNSPNWIRSFNGTIYDTIVALGTEMGVTSFDISDSLKKIKTILQPNWTNAQLLNYLAETVQGNNDVSCYKCFIKLSGNTKTLVFKAMRELVMAPLKAKYLFADKVYEDYKPAYNYEILDNYKLLGTLGCLVQKYSYFDYETGTFYQTQDDLSDVPGLAEYHLIDKNDPVTGLTYNSTGRTNSYHESFNAKMHSFLESRLNNLVKMWVLVDGDLSIKTGDIVRILFPQGFSTGQLFAYQYSGYWMVERVVLHFDDSFRMHLLLTRNGIDVETATSLVPSTIVRR